MFLRRLQSLFGVKLDAGFVQPFVWGVIDVNDDYVVLLLGFGFEPRMDLREGIRRELAAKIP